MIIGELRESWRLLNSLNMFSHLERVALFGELSSCQSPLFKCLLPGRLTAIYKSWRSFVSLSTFSHLERVALFGKLSTLVQVPTTWEVKQFCTAFLSFKRYLHCQNFGLVIFSLQDYSVKKRRKCYKYIFCFCQLEGY